MIRDSICGAFIVCLCGSMSAIAGVDAQLTLASDYIERGLSQTNHGPAYQGSAEYQFELGIFVGIWVSSAEFSYSDQVHAEIDYFVGYQYRLTSDLAFDITVIRREYPSADLARNYDWNELQLTAYLGDQWLLSWGLIENWLARAKTSQYLETSYRAPLPVNATVDITLGYQFTESLLGKDYGYAEIGISRPMGPLHARLAYSVADQHAGEVFGDLAASRWIASLIWKI